MISADDPLRSFDLRIIEFLMPRFFSLALSTLFLFSRVAYGGGAEISGAVSVDDQGHAILSLKLTNDTETAICFEDWFPSRTEIVVDDWLVRSFIVKDAEGNDVDTLRPEKVYDLGPPTLNRRVYMLKTSEDAEALIDLSSWYKLDTGSYSVSYLLSTLPCDKYADPESTLTSSEHLTYLAAADNLTVIKIMTRTAKDHDIVFLEPVRFAIPE